MPMSFSTTRPPPDLAQWFEEAYSAVWYALADRNIPQDEIEEAIQEAGAKAKKCELRTLAEFRSWLFRTALNWWITNYSKKRKPEAEKRKTSFHGWEDENGNHAVDPLESHRKLTRHDEARYNTVKRSLARLPAIDREMIEDRFFSDARLTLQQLADKYHLGHPQQADRELHRIFGEMYQMLHQAGISFDLSFEDYLEDNER